MLIRLLHQMKQFVEAVFTSYLLPALLVPLVWLLRRLTGRAIGGVLSLRVLRIAYEIVAILLVFAWACMRAGLRIEAGGRPATIAVWILFGALNFLFATLAVRFVWTDQARRDAPVFDRCIAALARLRSASASCT